MDPPYESRDVARAARDVRRKPGAHPQNGIESMSIDADSGRSGYARTSSGSWSYDGQDHLTELSDDTLADDPAVLGNGGRSAGSPKVYKISAASPLFSQTKLSPAKSPSAVERSDTAPQDGSSCMASTSTYLWPQPCSPASAPSQAAHELFPPIAGRASPPVDQDWHLVTAPADSELPPALRQGSDAQPQRGPKRTRMLASFHAQTREPEGAIEPRLDTERDACGMAHEPAESALTSRALSSSCMLPASSVRGHDAHVSQVTPPRLSRHRHARSAGGRPSNAASKPATRIPRSSADHRTQRRSVKPGRHAVHAHLPGDSRVVQWTAFMQHALLWLLFAVAAVCAVTAAGLLGFHALRQPYPARPAPAAADVQQLASLLDLLHGHCQTVPEGVHMAGPAQPRYGTANGTRSGACGPNVLYNRRATVSAALEVVSAAEVAQGRLRVALDQAAAPIPVSWEKASAELEATLSDLKRGQLVDLTMALQDATAARADVAAAARGISAAAGTAVERGRSSACGREDPAHGMMLTDWLDGEGGLGLKQAEAAHEALGAVAVLQGDLFAAGDAWRASAAEVAHAWASLNATCASAESRFVSLATWTAARRRPSATSVARVALYQLRRQVAAHALHASASGAAWLRRTRDAVNRGAQRGGRLLKRTGERVRKQARSGRAWMDHTAAQGATWLGGVATAMRSHAADAVDMAQQRAHECGLDEEVGKAWQSVKRVVSPIVDDIAPKARRTQLKERWSHATNSLAQHGSRVFDKLPLRLPRKKSRPSHSKLTDPATEPATDVPPSTGGMNPPPSMKPQMIETFKRSKVPECAADDPLSTAVTKSSSPNATNAGCSSMEGDAFPRLPLSVGDWHALPAAESTGAGNAAAAAGELHTAGWNTSVSAEAVRKSSGGWRGAAGLAQHASRGGALEASGPQKELDQIAELTAPWEILVLTPKLLRQAVNALGAELAGPLNAAAQLSRGSAAGGASPAGPGESDAREHGPDGGECACRWDRDLRERAGSATSGDASAICWCGIRQVMSEVYGGTA